MAETSERRSPSADALTFRSSVWQQLRELSENSLQLTRSSTTMKESGTTLLQLRAMVLISGTPILE